MTNSELAIFASLKRIGYVDLQVKVIDFKLDVPKGIGFYSAHFKIDVFNYLSSLPQNDYSILLDSDIVCVKRFNSEFSAIVSDGIPMTFILPQYGGTRKLEDVNKFDKSTNWLQWAGGEFIGGQASFWKTLYNEILSIKDDYWKVVNADLFHVGDEMLTSVALSRLFKKGISTIDAGSLGFVTRYWSKTETKALSDINIPFIHFPGDKVWFAEKDINKVSSIRDIFKGWKLYRLQQRLKGWIQKITKYK